MSADKNQVLDASKMKKLKDQVRAAKDSFIKKYGPLINKSNNHLACGLGLKDGLFTIEARLTNDNNKDVIPDTFEGFRVFVQVTGPIVARK